MWDWKSTEVIERKISQLLKPCLRTLCVQLGSFQYVYFALICLTKRVNCPKGLKTRERKRRTSSSLKSSASVALCAQADSREAHRMEIRKCDQWSDEPTDWHGYIGARNDSASKKKVKVEPPAPWRARPLWFLVRAQILKRLTEWKSESVTNGPTNQRTDMGRC